MDAKVTKKRLSDFLAYEWIVLIAVIVATVFLWEVIFSVASVRLLPGQSFKFFFDRDVASVSSFYDDLMKDDVFSYDVIGGVGYEKLLESTAGTVLLARTTAKEDDAIITDSVVQENGIVRAKEIIDGYNVYSLDDYLADAESYLKNFYDGDLLNEQNVRDNFRTRMKKDNRFRTEEEKLNGEVLEIERIKKLKKDVTDFRKVYDEHRDSGLFYKYTRYTQLVEYATADKEYYGGLLQKEIENNRENYCYGINVAYLKDGYDPVNYFRMYSGDEYTAENVVILMFKEDQGDLNYEGISFLTWIIRRCSNFLGE